MISVGVCVVLVVAGSVSGFTFNRMHALDLLAPSESPLEHSSHTAKYRQVRDTKTLEEISTTQTDISKEIHNDYMYGTTPSVDSHLTVTIDNYDDDYEYVAPKRKKKFQDILFALYGPLTWQDTPTEPSADNEEYQDSDESTVEPPEIQIDQEILDKVFGNKRIVPIDNPEVHFASTLFIGPVNVSEPQEITVFNISGISAIAEDRLNGLNALHRTWDKSRPIAIPPPRTVKLHNEVQDILIIPVNTSRDTASNAWKHYFSSYLMLLVVCLCYAPPDALYFSI